MGEGALPGTCWTPPFLWVSTNELVYVGPRRGRRTHATLVGRLLIAGGGVELRAARIAAYAPVLWQPARTRCQVGPAERLGVVYPRVGTSATAVVAGMTAGEGGVATGHVRQARLLEELAATRVEPTSLLAEAVGSTAPASQEPRLDEVVQRCHASPGDRWPVEAAAAVAGLSEWHFQRLFGVYAGTTFRRFRQWVRLVAATRLLAFGADLTTAAADVGFASPSHFSDTVRGAFGFTASELIAGGLPIHVGPA